MRLPVGKDALHGRDRSPNVDTDVDVAPRVQGPLTCGTGGGAAGDRARRQKPITCPPWLRQKNRSLQPGNGWAGKAIVDRYCFGLIADERRRSRGAQVHVAGGSSQSGGPKTGRADTDRLRQLMPRVDDLAGDSWPLKAAVLFWQD